MVLRFKILEMTFLYLSKDIAFLTSLSSSLAQVGRLGHSSRVKK